MGEHSGFSTDFLQQNFWPAIDYRRRSGIRSPARNIRRLLQQHREKLMTCLAGLAVGGIFLAGIYLFMVQLAEFGW
jgi:hypothetical protein